MKASQPKPVLEVYRWLPPCGETKVCIRLEGLSLEVDIYFDDPSDNSQELQRKTIAFSGTCFFLTCSVPGVEMTRCEYEQSSALASGALIEFERSEAAELWKAQLQWRKEPIRHFQIFLLSENKRIEVFAEDFRVIG